MSGHSHAKTVKRTKDANDAKRGKIFSKMARLISLAAKDGADPETNAKLKSAVETAKKFNLPKENIDRAIKKGTGEEAGEQLEEVLYEALGPAGVSIILEGITDNKNRTLAEVRQILQKHNAKLADEGSVKWTFEQKGVVFIEINSTTNKDDLELKAIEAGAQDIKKQKSEDGEFLEIYTKVEELEQIKEKLKEQGIEIESSSLGWIASQEIECSDKDKKKLEELFDDLDESDSIQEIYSNLKL